MRSWLRPFVPAWRFFNEAEAIPKLYARALQTGQIGSSWLPVLTIPKRRWYSFFFFPEAGLHHAACNALDQLVQQPENEPARRVIHRLVRRYLLFGRKVEPGGRYQFKVTAVQFFDGKAVEEDVLAGEGEL